jgi:enamine deaminase RidA (YjgF/YER057c/UK114 family)
MSRSKVLAVWLAAASGLWAGTLAAEPAPIRYPIPGADFPIAQAVEIPAGHSLVYVSGQVPSLVNPDADRNSVAAWGDTRVQTTNVLVRIEGILESLDLAMSDVVKMQVFLVGDPGLEGRMDFRGFMQGYSEFFGTESQPNLPARSVMQIAGLVNPGWLVEIEVVAVRRPGAPLPARAGDGAP